MIIFPAILLLMSLIPGFFMKIARLFSVHRKELLALEKSMEQELDWVRAFYVIRMQAEGLMEKE